MIKELRELTFKIDRVLELQEQILDKLNHGVILSNEEAKNGLIPKKVSKKEETDLQVKEMMKDLQIKFHYGGVLQRQFNLVQEPSISRIKHYLNTKDSSAFDGLKRK